MNLKKVLSVGMIFLYPLLIKAQKVEIDISACKGVYDLFVLMHKESSRNVIENELDSLLGTKAYQTMFSHYNRSWRLNTLPKDVFKRMVLSLKYSEVYKKGENAIADYMLDSFWKKYYNNLNTYKTELDELQKISLTTLIPEGVAYAQSWLPPEMKIPGFYFFVAPVGRSSAFVINNSQGYDFFQLSRDAKNKLNVDELVSTISHESHHLGIQISYPSNLSASDSTAFDYLSMSIPEGMANKFIDNLPGKYVPPVRSSGSGMDRALDSLWNVYHAEQKEIFNHLISQFEKAFSGQLSRKEFVVDKRDYWIRPELKPPVYYIGVELMGAIYLGLGKEAVYQALRDPRELFMLYNKAIKSKQELKNMPYIPEAVAQKAYQLGRI